MRIEMLVVGPLYTNCYLVWCQSTGKALIIDPGFSSRSELELVLGHIEKNDLEVVSIVNTHGHPDHVAGDALLKRETGAPVVIHRLDSELLARAPEVGLLFGLRMEAVEVDGFLDEGDVLSFGQERLRVMHTPGHTPGSITLLGDGVAFTGDTLFMGSIGRVDFPESSPKDMAKSLRRLMELPDETEVYPGHGPKTTIGDERVNNPFVAMVLETGEI